MLRPASGCLIDVGAARVTIGYWLGRLDKLSLTFPRVNRTIKTTAISTLWGVGHTLCAAARFFRDAMGPYLPIPHT